MKRVNLFLIGLVTLATLGVGFSSCGGGGKVSEMFSVVRVVDIGPTFFLELKNVTNRTLSGNFKVKVKFTDGTSTTATCHVANMEPGEVQKVYVCGMSYGVGVSSWSFIE